jgi:hypothetical protein
MDRKLHPEPTQRRFLKQYVLGEEPTILTVKRKEGEGRGFSVNIRGPFDLVEYRFPGDTPETVITETVIDATWAGSPESNSHLHCCWNEMQFAVLTPTKEIVRRNIDYDYQLSFFSERAKADAFIKTPLDDRTNDDVLFWFYVKDEYHKAKHLKEDVCHSLLE